MQTVKDVKGIHRRNDIFVDGIIPACYDGNVSGHSLPSALLSPVHQYSSQVSASHMERCVRLGARVQLFLNGENCFLR